MATRPTFKATPWLSHTLTVVAGGSVTAGLPVILSGTDQECTVAPAGSDLSVGVAQNSAAPGERVDVTLYGPPIPVVVGTGGATRGMKAVIVATGFTNAPAHDSSGATDGAIYGIFIQSGVAGDLVGMIPAPGNRGSA